MRYKLTYMLCVMIAALCQLSCTTGNSQQADGKPLLSVTIEPMRYFAETIAGDHWQVVSLVPKGMSPESYDPTPEQIVKLSNSQAYLHAGGYLGFEQTWLNRLQENAPHTRFINAAKGIEFIENEEESTHTDDNHNHAIDPHVWCSTKNATIMARNVLNALLELDTDEAHQADYQAGYEKLQSKIMQTDSLIRQTLAREGSQKAFVIYHPALTYYAREYGLQQLCIEQDGKEPTPAQLSQIMKEMTDLQVKTIFVQPEFDVRNTEVIARQGNIKVVQTNPNDYDWSNSMLQIANELSRED